MNVLVIAPHPDDESIGCGGSICLHADRGDRVRVVFLTSGELGMKGLPTQEAKRIRESEAESVADFLGVAELSFLRFPDGYLSTHIPEAARMLRPILEIERSGLIYLPHEYESHPDHAMAKLIFERASRENKDSTPCLLAYEVWTPLYHYNHVVDISASMARKIRAIRRYRSQNLRHHFDRSCRELNRYRGHLAFRDSYAEAFHYTPAEAGGWGKHTKHR